jgi:hypothetical protein
MTSFAQRKVEDISYSIEMPAKLLSPTPLDAQGMNPTIQVIKYYPLTSLPS